MAKNLTDNQNNNNNPFKVVLLLFVLWLVYFLFKLKNTI